MEVIKMKVPYQGRLVDGESIDFMTRKEDFNEYILADGKVIKIKMVATRIIRLLDEKSPDGTPVYLIQSQNIVAPIE
jgi:hypothetical protein